jgi:conjugal transfer pilin signal peptidase TrbI
MGKRWHLNHPLKSSLALLIGVATCLFQPAFRLNLSNSLPQTLFWASLQKQPFEKGQIVHIDHPKLNVSVGKIIAGKPGDHISIRNQRIFLNDVEIGEVQIESQSGKTYHPIQEGPIPAEHYFVYTSHPQSFDSRYAEFGLVQEEWIKEVLWPLF